ncbi:MAG: hypothetical protein ABSB22_17580 [Thermodesulfobacteriota bacterium]|jgi:hypothetical protein
MGKRDDDERSEIIDFEGVRHAPENEAGVIMLFAKLHRRLGFPVLERIQDRFPDCWVVQKTPSGTRKTWIEFEYESANFKPHLRQLHKIRPRKGFVVCWYHNWAECEKYADVRELRQYIGFGGRVWIQSTRPKFQGGLDDAPRRRKDFWSWTVAGRSRPGDILLMWRAGTKAEARKWGVDQNLLHSIANIYEITSVPKKDKRWKWGANVRQIALLQNPLRLGALKSDPTIKNTPWIRAKMQGRWDVTANWWRLREMIVRLNPYLKKDNRFLEIDSRIM